LDRKGTVDRALTFCVGREKKAVPGEAENPISDGISPEQDDKFMKEIVKGVWERAPEGKTTDYSSLTRRKEGEDNPILGGVEAKN